MLWIYDHHYLTILYVSIFNFSFQSCLILRQFQQIILIILLQQTNGAQYVFSKPSAHFSMINDPENNLNLSFDKITPRIQLKNMINQSDFDAEAAVQQILCVKVLASDFSLQQLKEVRLNIPTSKLNDHQKERVLGRVDQQIGRFQQAATLKDLSNQVETLITQSQNIAANIRHIENYLPKQLSYFLKALIVITSFIVLISSIAGGIVLKINGIDAFTIFCMVVIFLSGSLQFYWDFKYKWNVKGYAVFAPGNPAPGNPAPGNPAPENPVTGE